MNALVYVDIDRGIHNEKMKVARNEKRKKLGRFFYYKNIAKTSYFWGVFFYFCEDSTSQRRTKLGKIVILKKYM